MTSVPTFDQITIPLVHIRNQYLSGSTLHWSGPKTIPGIDTDLDVVFSPEGLAWHAERGRNFWDVYTMVAIQIGIAQGKAIESDKIAPLLAILERTSKEDRQ